MIALLLKLVWFVRHYVGRPARNRQPRAKINHPAGGQRDGTSATRPVPPGNRNSRPVQPPVLLNVSLRMVTGGAGSRTHCPLPGSHAPATTDWRAEPGPPKTFATVTRTPAQATASGVTFSAAGGRRARQDPVAGEKTPPGSG